MDEYQSIMSIPNLFKRKISLIILLFVLVACLSFLLVRKDTVDFSTTVKPIINKNCISCHGGVKQQGGFSLLFREEALAKTKSGKPAIIPGNAAGSEMIRRLTLKDPEERMPYQHPPLTKDEIEVLRQWVNQGAKWGNHWAYIPLEKTTVPKSSYFFGLIPKTNPWAKNEIDYFIADKWKELNLEAAPQANKETLLRRASLDLIGMPASESMANAFLKNTSSKAFEILVDSLLASPHFGEKWASMWMDLARYADSKGYERDDSRAVWRYRDWLINAYNKDMPYDVFLTKQLAGDLLPNPTDDDLIATAFQRNTMTNDEGGTDNEEFRNAAVLDRVNTTWEATMSTTFACVQCHSHPYDPFKHKDYYQFAAFYNNTRDEDTYTDYPLLRHFTDSAKIKLNKLEAWMKKHSDEQTTESTLAFLKTWQPAYNSLLCDSFTNGAVVDTKWMAFRDQSVCRLKDVTLNNKSSLIFRHQTYIPGGTWEIHIDQPNGPVIASIPIKKSSSKGGWEMTQFPIKPTVGKHDLYFTHRSKTPIDPLQNVMMFEWFYFTNPLASPLKPDFQMANQLFFELLRADLPTTPIMLENPDYMKRNTHVFERGNWQTKGALVQADVPASLGKIPANMPKNRLGMAKWLTDPNHPLASRTMVNRLWEQIFGNGLVETLEDMGSQGANPTHKELLDWLSYAFIHDNKWSIKKLLKQIILSATYQQSSVISNQNLLKDPANKYYARYPRVRLSAEQVRDQALAISGVMNATQFGPSVFPYQPKGIWLSPWNGADWIQNTDGNQYRRAVYTYCKRSAGYPSMLTFDGVSREICSPRRIRTNTPLQALATLNDSAYFDIAYHFAKRIYTADSSSKIVQIKKAYYLATYKNISENGLKSFTNLYNRAEANFKNNPQKITEFLPATASRKSSTASMAALTLVANSMLNLDEVLMKN